MKQWGLFTASPKARSPRVPRQRAVVSEVKRPKLNTDPGPPPFICGCGREVGDGEIIFTRMGGERHGQSTCLECRGAGEEGYVDMVGLGLAGLDLMP